MPRKVTKKCSTCGQVIPGPVQVAKSICFQEALNALVLSYKAGRDAFIKRTPWDSAYRLDLRGVLILDMDYKEPWDEKERSRNDDTDDNLWLCIEDIQVRDWEVWE